MKALVTGGAGFIGSHLVDALVARGDAVRVLDDLSTGNRDNLNDNAELIQGDINDPNALRTAISGVEVVFHQAALTSVARSIESPLASDMANCHGTLAVLRAAHSAGTRRVICASSSSVYGGAQSGLPSSEQACPHPRSPYAASKLAAEHYCRVFSDVYGLETVALRYFNVYGPRQRPDSGYSAAIPRFIYALLRGAPAELHGDGLQSRDFTFVGDVIQANLAAAAAPAESACGKAFNIAAGQSHRLVDVLTILSKLMDVSLSTQPMPARPGDVRHSRADVSAAADVLRFRAETSLEDGLRETVAWLQSFQAL